MRSTTASTWRTSMTIKPIRNDDDLQRGVPAGWRRSSRPRRALRRRTSATCS
jgi:hypothetical protein